MSCRSGCLTKDHESWGACARAANLKVSAVMESAHTDAWRKTETDLAAYRTARANGIQPGGTTVEKVREAESATRLLGRPYDADTMPPANMIVNKATAAVANAGAA